MLGEAQPSMDFRSKVNASCSMLDGSGKKDATRWAISGQHKARLCGLGVFDFGRPLPKIIINHLKYFSLVLI